MGKEQNKWQSFGTSYFSVNTWVFFWVMSATLLNYFFALNTGSMLSPEIWPIVLRTALVISLASYLFLWFLGLDVFKHLPVLAGVLYLLCFGYSIIPTYYGFCYFNTALDSSESKINTVEVVNKNDLKNQKVVTTSWRPGRKFETFFPTGADFRAISVGDRLQVTWREGFYGHPWVVNAKNLSAAKNAGK